MKTKNQLASNVQPKPRETKDLRSVPGNLWESALAPRRSRVLLIEDSLIIRDQLLDLIKQDNTVELVGCVENGIQGIEMLIALRPDVVLLDLQMPGLSGFDLLATIKRERPECKVMVLTCLADEATRDRCMKLGADYFFEKKTTAFEQIIHVLKSKG